ncbi:MAG: hypothetical protein K1Y01_18295 [Vicinamibacteria bacterium]|nr:hypothetical protein [Vicinamibacteria bacterium]
MTGSLRRGLLLVTRGFLGLAFAPFLLWLAWLSAKESVVEQARLSRLSREARQVAGVIERIDVEKRRPSLTDGGEDRTRWEYWRIATVRHSYGGRDYPSSLTFRLTGPQEQLRVGDSIPLLVLPDVPEKPYAPGTVAGSWIAVFVQPVLLLGVAALCAFGAFRRDLWRG